jgi:hypothetical protein
MQIMERCLIRHCKTIMKKGIPKSDGEHPLKIGVGNRG